MADSLQREMLMTRIEEVMGEIEVSPPIPIRRILIRTGLNWRAYGVASRAAESDTVSTIRAVELSNNAPVGIMIDGVWLPLR